MVLRIFFVATITASLISIAVVFPAFAGEWLVDPNTYSNGLKNPDWADAENKADILAWADVRKDEFLIIEDETERYNAIATYICDYLTYDAMYGQFIIHYVLREGRGLCADYAALSKALCEATDIKNTVVTGWTNLGPHAWNKVTLNGAEYYSDLTQLDSGHPQCLLSEEIWDGYKHEVLYENVDWFTNFNGNAAGEFAEVMIHCPEGYHVITSWVNGNEEYQYGSEADGDACWNGEITHEEHNARMIPVQEMWDRMSR